MTKTTTIATIALATIISGSVFGFEPNPYTRKLVLNQGNQGSVYQILDFDGHGNKVDITTPADRFSMPPADAPDRRRFPWRTIGKLSRQGDKHVEHRS